MSYHPPVVDVAGKRFGKLVVLEQAGFNSRGQSIWLCRCDCGTDKVIVGTSLIKIGGTKSCGCLIGQYKRVLPSARLIDLTGQRFGTLTVVSRDISKKTVAWLCRCDCGVELSVPTVSLRYGRRTDCRYRMNAERHGLCETPEYSAWHAMKTRCRRDPIYTRNGIQVCERWKHSFKAFLADVGPRPSSGHSLGRIDSKKDYEPSNVRWETVLEQARNTSRNRYVTFDGVTRTTAEWARALNLSESTIHWRIRNGQTVVGGRP